MTPFDPLAVAQRVIEVFDRLGAPYSVGGSIASAVAGEPRSTLDVDIVVDLTLADADAVASASRHIFVHAPEDASTVNTSRKGRRRLA